MQTISIWQCKPEAVFDEIRPYRSLSEWFGITLLGVDYPSPFVKIRMVALRPWEWPTANS